MQPEQASRLVIVSGPSGAGKTTVMREVFRQCRLPLVASVSATTRPPRPGEQEGIDYYFLKRDEFLARRQRGEFLESFEVFGRGHWYGTPAAAVEAALAEGKWVVLEIDVQGAMAVLKQAPQAITIFIRPRTWEQLERRLRGRSTESEEAIRRRLEEARNELRLGEAYRYTILNDEVEEAAREICEILQRHADASSARKVAGRPHAPA